MEFAAIDIGSFELELSIFDITGGRITCIDKRRHVIALGSDTYSTGVIGTELSEELCETVCDFVRIIGTYKIDAKNIMVCATSALREAKNRHLIEDRIRVSCGLKVNVLSNSEQRFMCYKALPVWMSDYENTITDDSAIVDVGFGSMQVSLYSKGKLSATQNLRLGALRMWGILEELSEKGLNYRGMAEELIDYEISTFSNYYDRVNSIKNIIAVGDCMKVFAVKILKLSGCGAISAKHFMEVCEEVFPMNPHSLAAKFDMSSEFVRLVIPVAMIYYRILIATGAKTLWIPQVSLVDGMAVEFAQKQKLIKVSHDFTEDIISSARTLNRKYLCNSVHTDFIEKQSLMLFDATKKLHGMGKRERMLMQICAIMHDCGKFLSITAPGQCAYDIVMASEILGLSHDERSVIANVIKCNTMQFDIYSAGLELAKDELLVIHKLTALLRLANALDRSHRQKIDDVSAVLKNGKLVIYAATDADIELEKGMFREKAQYFTDVFGVKPELKQRRK